MILRRSLCLLALIAAPALAQDQDDLAREIGVLSKPPVKKPLSHSMTIDGCQMRVEVADPSNPERVFIRTTVDLRDIVIAQNEERRQLGLIETGPSLTDPRILRSFLVFATKPGRFAMREKMALSTGEWTTKQERLATYALLSKTAQEPERLMRKLTQYTDLHCTSAPKGTDDQ